MHEVFGCGIDIEELSRFDKHLQSASSNLLDDMCTERELENIYGDKRVRFALSFSCKEAFFKALSVSWTNSGITWKDIELLFASPDLQNYTVHIHRYAKELFLKNNVKIGETSFDYNEEFVTFQVVLLRDAHDSYWDKNGHMSVL
jgi:phosphopantetheine--protein transferase-like protein